MSNVTVTLAHHLGADDAKRLGLPAEDLLPNTSIVLTEPDAHSLIGAGYVQVDPADTAAVRAILATTTEDPVGVVSGKVSAKATAEAKKG